MKSGSLNLLQPSGHIHACHGIALRLLLSNLVMSTVSYVTMDVCYLFTPTGNELTTSALFSTQRGYYKAVHPLL
jgi:hypothetical protein